MKLVVRKKLKGAHYHPWWIGYLGEIDLIIVGTKIDEFDKKFLQSKEVWLH